jgi:tetratricopeptide (TPR) repeat protein
MINTFVVALLCVLCPTTSESTQSVQSAALAEQAQWEYKNHHHDQAEKLFKAALDMTTDEIARGVILSDLGTLYLDEERLDEAQQIYIKALTVFRLNKDSYRTALLLRHLASVYSMQLRHNDAKKLLNEALKLADMDATVGIKLRVEILNSLGVAYFRDGNVGKAEKFFRQGLELTTTAQSARDRQVTTLLNNLGGVYYKKRDFENAEALLTKSLYLTEARYGPSYPALTYTLNTLGILYTDMRRYDDAEEKYKRGIAILEQNGSLPLIIRHSLEL